MYEKLTSQQLKSFLWEAANILRGKIDSGDFKRSILILTFFLVCGNLRAQIDFEDVVPEPKEKEGMVIYDSTLNYVEIDDAKVLVGQTLFATGIQPSPTGSIVMEGLRFKLQTKLRAENYSDRIIYLPADRYNSNYESIVGHYFEVNDAIEDDDRTYLKLYDKRRNNIVYFDYPTYESAFPFLVVGFYEKEKSLIPKEFQWNREVYLTNINTEQKVRVDNRGKLKISKITVDSESFVPYYFIEDKDGNSYRMALNTFSYVKSNLVKQSDIEQMTKKYGEKMGTKIAFGRIAVGMTKIMVADSWGNPIEKRKSVVNNVNMDTWVYNSHLLYFNNDKLDSWTEN